MTFQTVGHRDDLRSNNHSLRQHQIVENGYTEIVNSGPGDPGRPSLRELVAK